MEFFLIIPGWLIFALIVGLVGGAWALWQVLPTLLGAFALAIIILVIIGALLCRFPKATFAALMVMGICIVAYVYFFGPQGRLSKQAQIWRATEECIVYDEDYEIHTIDSGSYFAIFEMKDRYSHERNVFAKSEKCVVHSPEGESEWFYLGLIPQSDKSREMMGVDAKTLWHREEVHSISMYEYENSDWWVPAT